MVNVRFSVGFGEGIDKILLALLERLRIGRKPKQKIDDGSADGIGNPSLRLRMYTRPA